MDAAKPHYNLGRIARHRGIMSKKLRPEDFLDCNLIDKTYLDDEGYLLSSAVNNGRELRKSFGRYMLDYSYSKNRRVMSFSIYNEIGDSLAVAEYYTAWRPSFRLLKINHGLLTRESFLEFVMPLDKDLAFWLLWNI